MRLRIAVPLFRFNQVGRLLAINSSNPSRDNPCENNHDVGKVEKKAFIVVVAATTPLFGFTAQFVALRTMHPTVTVIQLASILAMTALRSFAHMQRENRNDIKNPQEVDGHELGGGEWAERNCGTATK